MRRFIENLSEGIIISKNDRIRYINSSGLRELEYEIGEIENICLSDIFIEDKKNNKTLIKNKKGNLLYCETKEVDEVFEGELSKMVNFTVKGEQVSESITKPIELERKFKRFYKELKELYLKCDKDIKVYNSNIVMNNIKGNIIELLDSLDSIFRDGIYINAKTSEDINYFDNIALLLKNAMTTNKVTELEDILNKSMEELNGFLSISDDIMTVTDIRSKIIKINDSASKILGWNKEELLQKSWVDMIYPDDLEMSFKFLEDAIKDKEFSKSFVNRYITKSGEMIWLKWNIKYGEDKETIFAVAKDITESTHLKEDSTKYEEALNIETLKNEFFSNISHEFKTPLNIILSAIQVVDLGIENEKIVISSDGGFQNYKRLVRQNAYRLLGLINNLIDVTKIDSKNFVLNLENKNIVYLIEDIVTSIIQYSTTKGILIEFDTDSEEVMLACDKEAMDRIILNLISNAIKYTKEEGEIKVKIVTEEKQVIVSVEDNGIGIPEEKLDNIFGRYVQVDNSITRSSGGSGIGLSLVKNLVEIHGGEVRVKSKVGVGTKFEFTLPIRTIDYDDNKIEESDDIVKRYSVDISEIYSYK